MATAGVPPQGPPAAPDAGGLRPLLPVGALVTPEDLKEAIHDLVWRLRHWEVQVWIRHAENPTPAARGANCSLCKGIGRVHLCLVPKCSETDDLSECLHPDEYELTAYHKLLAEAGRLLAPLVSQSKRLSELSQDPKKLLADLLSQRLKR